MKQLGPALFALLLAQVCAGQQTTPAADAHTGLEGVWTAEVAGTYDLTDPRGGEIRVEEVAQAAKGVVRKPNPSRIVDPPSGKIPYQPWAEAKQKYLQSQVDNPIRPEHIDTQNRCLPDGALRDLLHGGFRIILMPGYVLIAGEENYGFRIIPLDGRPHIGKELSLWMGDSRGRWDGNSLLVDVTNSNGKPRLDMVANFYSDAVHFTERFTPLGSDELGYEVTVEDPRIYTRPWKLAARFKRAHPNDYEFFEDACHEGEHSADKMLLSPGAQPKN